MAPFQQIFQKQPSCSTTPSPTEEVCMSLRKNGFVLLTRSIDMSRDRENYRLFSHGRLRSVLVALGAFCAFCVLLSPPAFAQGAAGSVSGAVRDTSGAVIPSAPVTLTNTATGVKTTTHTNNEGLYVFPY